MSEKIATREAYGKALVELGAANDKVVVLDADLAGATMTKHFKAAYPDRFFDCGIAECNMMDIGAGLSTMGLIKSYGFELGLQMMTGLYMSSPEDEFYTAEQIIAIKPKTVRIYPVVILGGTKLADLYQSGVFRTYAFDEMAEICAKLLEMFEAAGIKVIKLGLHSSCL